MSIYTNQLITHTIIDEETNTSRTYKANLMKSRTVSLQGFKLAKVCMPSFGAAMDAIADGKDDIFSESKSKISEIMFFLSENLTEEHFADLEGKLMGSLYFNGKHLGEDWEDHFDNHKQDFLEVLAWVGEENFKDFFMQSTIVARLKKNLNLPTWTTVQEKLGLTSKEQEQDNSEES